MKHGRIGNESALREAAQIRTPISDLDRIVQFLNCDIATEELTGHRPNSKPLQATFTRSAVL